MKTERFHVSGMHCASCVAIIERSLKKIDGVTDAAVNIATEEANVTYDESKVTRDVMNAPLSRHNYTLHSITTPEHNDHANTDSHTEHVGSWSQEQEKELARLRPKVLVAFPLAALVFFLMLWEISADTLNIPFLLPMRPWRFAQLVIASIILFWSGNIFLSAAFRFFRTFVADMNSLVGIGTGVAYLYSAVIFLLPEVQRAIGLPEDLYFDATIIVAGFVLFGKYLELRSKMKTGAAISALMKLQATVAHVKRGTEIVDIPLTDVVVGDVCLVKVGEKIPVDGIIEEGTTHIDESMMTGESMPVERTVGQEVIGSTVNQEGIITIKARHVGSSTVLAQIIRMVQEAQGSKAPIQRLADNISAYFVPTVLVLSVVSVVLWFVIGRTSMSPQEIVPFALASFVGILVIACPCALGLATPTAIIVSTGTAARHGILVKNAESLERAKKVNAIIFDKTGTLTVGKPQVVAIGITDSLNVSEDDFLRFVASIEQFSEHPLGVAILNTAKEKRLELQTVADPQVFRGQGVAGTIEQALWRIGTSGLLEGAGIVLDQQLVDRAARIAAEGKTVVYVARANEHVGILALADVLKKESIDAIRALHALGIMVVMMTGDREATARVIAKQAGIDEIFAEVKPEEKAAKVKALQQEGKHVAMVGDGINDAPALAQADLGIAMSTGTDVAMESADMTILHGDLRKVESALGLSRRTMRTIKQNLFWAFIYNVLGIPIAAGVLYPLTGMLLNPAFAGMAMAFSSVSVVANSLRLRRVR